MAKLLVPTGVAAVIGTSGTRYAADNAGEITCNTAGDIVSLINAGCIFTSFAAGGINNLIATTDPVVGSDSTLDYAQGSFWYNLTGNRLWVCQSAGVGAAVWILSGVVPGVGVEPASMLTQFGASVASFAEEGNINRQISAAGVNPGGTGVDSVLAFYSLPANSFDLLGRGLAISASGSFAANGNTKRVKLIFNPATAVVGSTVGAGGVTIADTGAVVTNNAGWSVQGQVFKYGANGSNTQIGIHSQAQMGNAVASLLAPSLITAVESGAILIAVTGNATTAVGDIAFNWFEINAMN